MENGEWNHLEKTINISKEHTHCVSGKLWEVNCGQNLVYIGKIVAGNEAANED